MQILWGLPETEFVMPSALAIGNFDGVHRGHQALIEQMQATAAGRGWRVGVLTFYPHPAMVLHPQRPFAVLTTLEERLALLAMFHLDFALVHPFSLETAHTPARDFVTALVRRLRLRQLWVGPDFALGHNRKGDVPMLQELGQEIGFSVWVIEPVRVAGMEARSGVVRQLLLMGQVEKAAVLLGRPYRLPGIVVSGDKRGQALGFPTVNLSLAVPRVVPADGVYVVWAELAGQMHPAVCNIGVRPTVNGRERTVEAHLLDFDGDLYESQVALHFVSRLRDEIRFPNVEALKKQIAQDVRQARSLLAITDPPQPLTLMTPEKALFQPSTCPVEYPFHRACLDSARV
ncbi:MAG TPA: bifunctional riboflavin kinase/FAD synthetase [Anaerolineae bacterium]|nr:bifunctional riboflavin kinase/FAD synthetase [Anaerolineae bacterium]